MKKIKILFPLFAAIIFFSFTEGSDDNLTALINSNNPDKELTFSKFKNIMRGRTTRWSNNKPIKLAFLKPDTRTGNLTAYKLFQGANGAKMNKYFMKMVFQGKMSAPQFFDNEDNLKAYIKSTEGSIGIITSKTVGNFSPVLNIDGKQTF